MIEKQQKVWFLRALGNWHRNLNKREMPWKGIKDPYRIWLSEVILQQTRVEQGLDYYLKFTSAFPDVHALARAPESNVFKLWEGLGYYSRCRNLIATAKTISHEFKGIFPDTKEGLLALKGVGPYTAAAIGSFAFGLPLAVCDGNVMRVLSRVFGYQEPINSNTGKIYLEQMAQALLDFNDPAAHNQSMMDLGATICKPKSPLCSLCPFEKKCVAKASDTISLIPVKMKKQEIRERFFHYLVLEAEGKRLIRKRDGKDIWQDLHEYLLKETDEPADEKQLADPFFWGIVINPKSFKIIHLSEEIKHQLTHIRIRGRLMLVRLQVCIDIPGYQWVDLEECKQLAFPRLITRFHGQLDFA